MGVPLFPVVRWAQNEDNIFLKIELLNADEPEVTITENSIEFQAIGEGAKGRNVYHFAVDLFDLVNVQNSRHNIEATCVRLTLQKEHNGSSKNKSEKFWTRLTANSENFSWLKLDFDKWCDPDDSGSENEFQKKMRNFDTDENEKADQILRDLGIDESNGNAFTFQKRNLTKTYLVTYNAVLFIGFLLIVVDLIKGYYFQNTNYFQEVWSQVSHKVICCQVAQFLEIAHASLGYVKSSPLTTTLQVFGRGFVLFVVLQGEERMHDKPFIFYLFLVWSLIELIRYPYYLLSTIKKEIGLLTYLRYTAWIILYPLGFLCEGIIILRAMPFYEQTQKFSYQLPNEINMSFDFPSALKLYLLFVFLPGALMLMSHMRSLRLKKLCKRKAD